MAKVEGVVEREGDTNHLADLALYPPEELDANQFGAALLMPSGLVQAQRERMGDDVDALAAVFHVSAIAMERRLWFLEQAGD